MECNTFAEFYGNENIIKRLKQLICENKLPHAIIIEGDRGLGKRTLAKLIAKSTVCLDSDDKPCGQCKECIMTQVGSHPDISIIEGTGKLGGIPVDSIRIIRTDAYIVPSQAKKKVYILCDADNTGIAAQNAFLKVFEEPPKSALFIITCISASNLLETIRSRAVTFTLAPVEQTKAIEAVSKLMDYADREQIAQAVSMCGGNIGKCIAGLSDDNFIRVAGAVTDIVNALVEPTEADLLYVLHSLEKDRDFARSVIENFSLTLRDALSGKFGSTGKLSGNNQAVTALVKHMNKQQILSLIDDCDKASTSVERFTGMPLAMTHWGALMRKSVGK